MRLDKYQKCRNIISQTSLLSSYTGSILMQYTSYIGSFSMDGIYLYIFYIGRVIRCTCAYVINSCYITIEYFINFGESTKLIDAEYILPLARFEPTTRMFRKR